MTLYTDFKLVCTECGNERYITAVETKSYLGRQFIAATLDSHKVLISCSVCKKSSHSYVVAYSTYFGVRL